MKQKSYLLEVWLKDFKSFRTAELSFLRPLTVLVGTNASGKSNLKDALRFLHGVGLGYQVSEILGGKTGPSGVLEWRGIRGGIGEIAFGDTTEFTVGCAVGVKGDDASPFSVIRYAITINVADRRFGPRVVRESLKTQDAYLWDSHADDDPPAQTVPHQIRIRHQRGGNHRKHGKVSDCLSLKSALGQIAFDPEVTVLERRACSAVIEQLRGIRFLDLDPDAMREPSPLGTTILGDRGENLSAVLSAICTDESLKSAFLSWVRALMPLDAIDLEFETAFSNQVMVYLVESGGARISAQSASAGRWPPEYGWLDTQKLGKSLVGQRIGTDASD
jgi:predicted ATPase